MFQRLIFAECKTPPDRRVINFVFNAKGNSGKSLLGEYLEWQPQYNAVVAPQLAAPERYNAALIDQFEQHFKKNAKYPSVVIFDFSKNESAQNIEPIYATMENLKNGKLDSTFYGRHTRIKFPSPHVFVFTNTVPNMSALSEDRFNLTVIADKAYNFISLKCSVKLLVEESNRGLVSWSYEAKPMGFHAQQSYYQKIADHSLLNELYEALTILDGKIYTEVFGSSIRTAPLHKAPESVQREINLRYNKKTF